MRRIAADVAQYRESHARPQHPLRSFANAQDDDVSFRTRFPSAATLKVVGFYRTRRRGDRHSALVRVGYVEGHRAPRAAPGACTRFRTRWSAVTLEISERHAERSPATRCFRTHQGAAMLERVRVGTCPNGCGREPIFPSLAFAGLSQMTCNAQTSLCSLKACSRIWVQ